MTFPKGRRCLERAIPACHGTAGADSAARDLDLRCAPPAHAKAFVRGERRACVTDTSTFAAITLERVTTTLGWRTEAPSAVDVRDRYLGRERVDRLLAKV